MVKKWSVSYPAVNGTEQRRVYVYLPTMYEAEPDRRFPVLYMFDGQNVFFDEVIVGPYIMPKVAGAFSTLTAGMQSKDDIDGMIGNNFLKRFNMLIDFKSDILYLQPNNFYYTPFYNFLVK